MPEEMLQAPTTGVLRLMFYSHTGNWHKAIPLQLKTQTDIHILAIHEVTTIKAPDPSQRLIGYWEGHDNNPAVVNGKEVAPPNDRPPFVFELRVDQTFKVDMFFVLEGTWKLLSHEGNVYKIETTITVEPPEFKDMPQANRPRTRGFTITLLSDDEAKIAPSDDPKDSLTFKRKKR